LAGEQIGPQVQFLKANQIVEALIFQNKIINISLPIKVQLKVIEAPPGIRGDRSQAGTKQITLETGAKINAPLFIEEGEVIEVNTETGEYVRRADTTEK
jgi:elongation factor P